ncbi:hypothetical protein [Allosphingosinicella deserti]|uniref:Glycosyltransferase RgtA/B/C/D-like domain-containing protein n=1 Tax=Allosphingosinicella deserti TaxID=2116704 RepID=A0A2P7QUQ9_9SPHN|nr:hypothetical protein [Sphingomonas deserti]PSJ41674.1 hypothetical protein C7I55_05075 [Sphingomonas deserti]
MVGERAGIVTGATSRLLLLSFIVLIAFANAILSAGLPLRSGSISVILFLTQDQPLLPLVLIFFLIRFREQGDTPSLWPATSGTRHGTPLLLGGTLLAILFCRLAGAFILHDHDLSRDEQMATFDAAIFASGRLFWPIEQGWRPFADALNTMFIQPIGRHEAWVSAYLPVNAALRGLAGLIGGERWVSPLLVGIGIPCLWGIARQIAPDRPSVARVSVALYVGSSQILIAGTTTYAMSAHLGFNLLWLWLFLKGRRRYDLLALGVGFLATGLHQPLFHPMFVAPFLLLLIEQRAWPRLALFILVYGIIGLFWLAWPNWISSHAAVPLAAGATPAGIGYLSRLQASIAPFGYSSLWLMAVNLLRLAAWQHLLLLPLAAVAIRALWRHDPLVRALALTLLLPILVMTVLLPYQGHGWGYRYLHGVLGSFCLLGGLGWAVLEKNKMAPGRAFRWATALSLLVMLPVHLWMANRLVAPMQALDRRIAETDADFVIVDSSATSFAADLVINRPDLSNRPLRMTGWSLGAADMASLCRRGTISFVDGPDLAPIARSVREPVRTGPTPDQIELHAAARAAGCVQRPFSPTGE